VNRPDVTGALEGRRLPVIVTCRAKWEGGAFEGSEEERKAILAEAIQQGAEYVDIEFRAGFDDVIRAVHGRGIVLSIHDFEGVPVDLVERVRAMRQTGAEITKVAVYARSLTDNLSLLGLQQPGRRSVFVAMGPSGVATRVLAARFGSEWSYAGDGYA